MPRPPKVRVRVGLDTSEKVRVRVGLDTSEKGRVRVRVGLGTSFMAYNITRSKEDYSK